MAARRSASLAIACVLALGALYGAVIARASAGPAPGVVSARTLDTAHDGYIDEVQVVLAAAPSPVTRVGLTVTGYVVRRLLRQGRVLTAELVQHDRPDTGARPRLWLRVGARLVTLRASDGAPPVLLSAHMGTTEGTVVLVWSEPVRARWASAAADMTLQGASGATWLARAVQPAGDGSELDVEQAGQPTTIRYSGTTIADLSGNLAASSITPIAGAPSSPAGGSGGSGSGAGTGGSTGSGTGNGGSAGSGTPNGGGAGSGAAGGSDEPTEGGSTGWNVLNDPIDPTEQTDLAFCDRSFWLQPWRAYLDTPPASALSDALGINFNVTSDEAPAVAQLLGDNDFTHARLEEGWDNMSYADPTRLADPSGFVAELQALQANGIRPLILLNANQGGPGPMQPVTLVLTAPAAAGARTVQLSPQSVSAVVPGLTGFSDSTTAAAVIITSVAPDGTATLSQPLPISVPAGSYPGDTLRYEPFAPPLNADGTPNASFEATLSGWMSYVAAVTETARAALGGDNFDVEIWNELSFGSAFLDASNYYSPVPPALQGTGDTDEAILASTLGWLREPANGMMGVGVTDGFASQTPFDTGAGLTGLDALSKHPYAGARTVFGPDTGPRACRPLNALGQVDGTYLGGNLWEDDYTPSFTDYFPEYYLTAIQTESLIRDISPITTMISGVPHGRNAEPPTWVTETNIDSDQVSLSGADVEHMQAKATLRTLVSFVNKGVSQVDFYAVSGSEFGLVDPTSFITSGGASGGPTIDALGRMFNFIGPTDITQPRSLTLQSIAQWGDDAQFAGDGTPAHPPLYNRDVLGVFPFQVDDDTFVVPAYVMTRNIAELYDPSAPATDVTRYDLPPESYRLTLGGVDGTAATVQAYDPLSDESVPAQIVGRTPTSVTVQVDLTDSPRLLRIQD